ncbi:mechanosensitive ion channel family protein [Billgrantia bachuensis]|uniref:Mechanosensitive ion channel family protein n=1 Tax=Billgrantia bachuensis TaxID=2717286 RepID=A0ABX0PPP0_9GAMM|nr:mechanosensitive ion channel family protein [Halomonas bachuensis]NIC05088.1 mechanosensitive ion channel family protein [Halomonas bachuensis]
MLETEFWRDWQAWLNQPMLATLTLLLIIAFVSYLVLRLGLRLLVGRIVDWSSHGRGHWRHYAAHVARHTSRLLLAVLALQIALFVVELDTVWEQRVSHLWFLVLAFQFGLWVDAALNLWKENTLQSEAGRDNQLTVTMVSLMFRTGLWAVVLLSVLANLGVNITAFVASLGIGGIAIALAVQALLGDLFASASIGIDKPFKVGHFIVFGDIAGTIEYIGLKTTRIRSLSGEQVLISNTRLLQQTIHNYNRMHERRVVFNVSLSFRTSLEKVREVPELVRQVVESVENTRFDRAHLRFFDDYALKYEIVYYVLSSDFTLYMDIQQAINFGLLAEFQQRDIKFAMPVRSIEFLDEVPLERSVGGQQVQQQTARS